jgi:protein Mpv17
MTHDDRHRVESIENDTIPPPRRRELFPSVPISYDECGIVQADAVVVVAASTIAIEEDYYYPPPVRLLFRRDDNGRTLATRLFNAALLAASFGYALASVLNIDGGMTRGWSPGEITMRIPLDTWASYENSLSEKPVATKTIINIVIYLLGDWLSQTLFRGGGVLDFDASRTLRNGFVGMCFGPAVHEYYEFSDWILPVEGLTFGITNRAFKILMDQTIYLSVKCSIYIMAIAVLNGESVEDGADNVKNRLKPIMFTAWKFWPLVHCVTYGLIPSRHRILWVNSVDLVWNAILASKARGDDDDKDDDVDGGGDNKSRGVGSDDKDDGGASETNDDGAGFDVFRRLGLLLSSLDSSRVELGVSNEVSVVESSVDAPDSSDAKTLLAKEKTRR